VERFDWGIAGRAQRQVDRNAMRKGLASHSVVRVAKAEPIAEVVWFLTTDAS